VDRATIDTSVRRVLEAKFKLGLFERPYVDAERIPEIFAKPEAKETSRLLALESMTLLKNEGSLLPLPKNVKSIAVIGPSPTASAAYWRLQLCEFHRGHRRHDPIACQRPEYGSQQLATS